MTNDWREDAACLGTGHDPFFPEKDDNIWMDAIKLCNTCPVKAECLEWALSFPERYGVWGGTTEKGRRRLLREARRAAEVDEVAVERVMARRGPGTGLSRAERLELVRRLKAQGKGASEVARILRCSGSDARKLIAAAGEAA